jgi:hypothetical protein
MDGGARECQETLFASLFALAAWLTAHVSARYNGEPVLSVNYLVR